MAADKTTSAAFASFLDVSGGACLGTVPAKGGDQDDVHAASRLDGRTSWSGRHCRGDLTHGETLTVPRPERAALKGARAAVHEELERLESVTPAGRTRDDRLWRAYLDVVEKELEHGHVDVAVRVWHDAYGAALASGSWESMIAAGDAFMAIGRASGSVRGARMNAREAYLSALIRARRDRSVDGAIRSAEAFRGLDDRAVGEQCLHIAAQLAAGDEQAQQRVLAARQRWATWQTATGVW